VPILSGSESLLKGLARRHGRNSLLTLNGLSRPG
jgi:hypothetical protein